MSNAFRVLLVACVSVATTFVIPPQQIFSGCETSNRAGGRGLCRCPVRASKQRFATRCVDREKDTIPFFNREKETEILTSTFKSSRPRFSVILGPPSTGKTALLKNAVKECGCKTLRINLRGNAPETEEQLINLIKAAAEEDSMNWKRVLDFTTSYLKTLKLETYKGGPLFEFKLSGAEVDNSKITFFNQLANILPKRDENGYPIFVIDEANSLRTLAERSPKVNGYIPPFSLKLSHANV